MSNTFGGKRKDSEKKFRLLFETYYVPLCNYAHRIIRDEQKAEDLVQGLFIQLWENQKFLSIQKPESFLLKSTRNKCIDLLRAQKKEVLLKEFSPEDLQEIPPDEWKEKDIEAMLHYLAASLPPKTREVFLLSRAEKLSNQEIASQLKISVKTVENQMTRALRKLRLILEKLGYLNFL